MYPIIGPIKIEPFHCIMSPLVAMETGVWTVPTMHITRKALPTILQELQARAFEIPQGYYPICMLNSRCKHLMLSTS